MRYLNFDVWLYRKDGKSYRVRVQGPSEREWAMDTLLPEGALGRRAAGGDPVWEAMLTTPGAGGGPEPEPREMGRRLFESIFRGEALACLWASEEEAKTQGASLRIRLRLAETPELAALPWELLYDPARGRFLSRSSRSPIVRFLETPDPYRPLWVEPPLSVLAVLPSPRGMQALAGDEEWRRLQEALAPLVARRLISLDRLDEPTLEGLQGALRRHTVHVAHFVGHGAVQRATGEGGLYFEDRKKNAHFVRGETLGGLFHDSPELRLVMLNACNGARGDRRSVFAGCAQQLILQGVPAVVAMQFPVTDRAAVALAQEFYRALADGYPVDACVSEARKRLAGSKGREWATPVLFLRAPDGVLFEVGGAPALPPSTARELGPVPGHSPRLRKLVTAVVFTTLIAAGGGLWAYEQLWPQEDADAAHELKRDLFESPVRLLETSGGEPEGESAASRESLRAGNTSPVSDRTEPNTAVAGDVEPEERALAAEPPTPEPRPPTGDYLPRGSDPRSIHLFVNDRGGWARGHRFESLVRGELDALSRDGYRFGSAADSRLGIEFRTLPARIEAVPTNRTRCELAGELLIRQGSSVLFQERVAGYQALFSERDACSAASGKLAKEVRRLTASQLNYLP